MSTRVHELAKELGVKSQELLDRIQEWGFEVKSSIFAGLDPIMVERIRERHQGASAGPAAPAPVAKPPSRPDSPAPSETPAIRSTATAPPKPEPAPAVAAPPPVVADAAPEPPEPPRRRRARHPT